MTNFVKIMLVAGVVVALVSFVRQDFGFPLVTIVPFLSDEPSVQYDLAGIIMCVITAGATRQLRARG